MSKKLYVANLAYEVTEEDLRENFREIGEVISANIVKDRYSGNSRGFGFVEMGSEEDTQEAIKKLNGAEVAGRKIVVQEAKPRRESSHRSSGFRRRGRF